MEGLGRKVARLVLNSLIAPFHHQLKELLVKQHIPLESAENDSEVYRKSVPNENSVTGEPEITFSYRCFLAGHFYNVAALQPDNSYRVLKTGQEVHIHPSSCLVEERPRSK